MRYFLLLCCCAALIFGGTDTKPKVEDYEAHAQANNMAIGAEYTVHSFSRGEQMYLAKDYLLVEVALFPAKGTTFDVQHSEFSLRINGKNEIGASAPNMVIDDMRHPEFQPAGPIAQASGGMNGHDVIIGGPPQDHPFPGSTVPTSPNPQPRPPLEIPKDNPSGVKAEPVDPYKLLMETALEEGQHHAPISGFLYFHFRGNIKSIKTLELVYQDTVLKLR
jgi:hypothetical protein